MSEWIKCSNKTPESACACLVASRILGIGRWYMRIGFWDSEEGFTEDDGDGGWYCSNATHWTHIPDPPKEDE